MARVSQQELFAGLKNYADAWESLGVSMATLKMQRGSSTQGIAYRITYNNGSNAPGTRDGYLGFTASEALFTLRTIARTIEDLNFIRMVESERE